jgi:hypothetical protein
MRFDETEFYKHFGNAEWKVTTNEGKVYKSANWLPIYEDKNYKEGSIYVAENTAESLSVMRSKSKTVIATKFKAT